MNKDEKACMIIFMEGLWGAMLTLINPRGISLWGAIICILIASIAGAFFIISGNKKEEG